MHQKRIPLRMCAGCGESKPKKELVRVVRSPEGEISLRFLHARQHRAKAVLCDIPISTASRSLNNLLEKGEADATERLIYGRVFVYASPAFVKAHGNYGIPRSISRAGTPTDHAIMEALNG